jgi:hypothetical protein
MIFLPDLICRSNTTGVINDTGTAYPSRAPQFTSGCCFILKKTGSVIYVQEENWETSITIFLNVLNLLMKENFILILSI